MLCRRTALQAGALGVCAVALDACARKSSPQPAAVVTSPATGTTAGSAGVYGPQAPLGPAIPTDLPTSGAVPRAVTTGHSALVTTFAPPPATVPTSTVPVQTRTNPQTPTAQPPPANAIAYATDVPIGQSRLVQTPSGAYVLVTRTGATAVVGFSAVCTHAGCTVSGNFQCPCHGSAFNPRTGAVVQGPAVQPLASVGVAVQGNYIVQT